jgi:hypothetical protein
VVAMKCGKATMVCFFYYYLFLILSFGFVVGGWRAKRGITLDWRYEGENDFHPSLDF